jgi:molybdopterin molybdotransferase
VPALTTARRLILDRLLPLPTEEVSLAEADGRILASDVTSPFDLPHWDNSAMDGFALRSADCLAGAVLRVTGMIAAGDPAAIAIEPGCAAQILTGAPMPAGADTVVPFEEVDDAGGTIRLAGPSAPGQHVRRRGGDIRAGSVCLPLGRLVGPPEIAVLAALGRTSVAVHRRPRVAIVSTGNELVAPGVPLRPGAIYDSNGPMLAAAVSRAGGTPIPLGVAPDDTAGLRQILRQGLAADILLTSAGVSTGERDLVRDTLAELGAEEAFYKVDIQPGRPFACAFAGSTCILSLPGNPVAAMLTFEVLVRPAIRWLQGITLSETPPARARLADPVQPRPDRITLLRVVLEPGPDGLRATSAGRQATGFLKTLSDADALAFVPPGLDPLPAGTLVDIRFLRHETAMGEGRG